MQLLTWKKCSLSLPEEWVKQSWTSLSMQMTWNWTLHATESWLEAIPWSSAALSRWSQSLRSPTPPVPMLRHPGLAHRCEMTDEPLRFITKLPLPPSHGPCPWDQFLWEQFHCPSLACFPIFISGFLYGRHVLFFQFQMMLTSIFAQTHVILERRHVIILTARSFLKESSFVVINPFLFGFPRDKHEV